MRQGSAGMQQLAEQHALHGSKDYLIVVGCPIGGTRNAKLLDGVLELCPRGREGIGRLAQAQIAEPMGTTASAASSVEASLWSERYSPSFATLCKYAVAYGKKLVISFA